MTQTKQLLKNLLEQNKRFAIGIFTIAILLFHLNSAKAQIQLLHYPFTAGTTFPPANAISDPVLDPNNWHQAGSADYIAFDNNIPLDPSNVGGAAARFFTAGVAMTAGKTYKIEYTRWINSFISGTIKLSVMISPYQSAGYGSILLGIESNNAFSTSPYSGQILYTPGTSGTYYVQFEANIDSGMPGQINLDEVKISEIEAPSLTTSTASSITLTSAVLGGFANTDGGLSITESGIVYSTATNPTTANSKVIMGSGVGGFTQTVSGLTLGTLYYVRTYAINSGGTYYGNEVTFTTLTPVAPNLSTDNPYSVTLTSAVLGGYLGSNGGSPITERGIVYSTAITPTTANSKVIMGSNLGGFTQTVSGLTLGTLYHVRAYAINSFGTWYGNEVTFQTLNTPCTTTGNQTLVICQGSSVTIGGNTHTSAGVYTDVIPGAGFQLCDSTVVTTLTVMDSTLSQTLWICPGDTATVGTSHYTAFGTYTDVFTNYLGCDSTVHTTVSSNIQYYYNPQVLCEGDTLTVLGNNYYASGNYYDSLSAVGGCDSVIYTLLSVYPNPAPVLITKSPNKDTVCAGTQLTLDATNNYLKFNNNSPVITSGMTLQLGNHLRITLEAMVYSKIGGAINIFSDNAGTMEFTGNSTFITNGANTISANFSSLPLNKWNHIVYVFDGTGAALSDNLKVYVNGVLQTLTFTAQSVNPGTTSSGVSSIKIGDQLVGGMKNVRFWNQDRTQAEVQASFNTVYPTNQAGSILEYAFQQQTGSMVDNNANSGVFSLTLPSDFANNSSDFDTTTCWTESITYSWSPWISNGFPFSVYQNTTDYVVTISDFSTGCSVKDSVHLTVIPSPAAPVITGNIEPCFNTQTTLSTGTYATYDWQTSDGGWGNNQSITIGGNYNPITVTVTDSTGCSATSYPMGVFVQPMIDLTTYIQTNPFAGYTQIASSTWGGFQWLDCDNNNAPIAGEINQSYKPATSGNYAVALDVMGCLDTTACTNVNVCMAKYDVTYDSIQNTFYITPDAFTANAAVSYEWTFIEDWAAPTISTLANITYAVALDTTIWVCMKMYDASGDSCTYCQNIGIDTLGNIIRTTGYTIVVNTNPATGVSHTISTETSLSVYPNPNNGVFTIKDVKEGVYSITNALGQTIQLVKLNSANNYTINVDNLSNGIYFIVGLNNNKMTRQKVVVAK